MKKIFLLLFLASFSAPAQNDVFYHVFQRSFFDSNDDGNGDLEGIRQKLDYLQELGVTTVLLTPLYASDFYHNYFAYDFEKIDPEYGTMQEYTALVKEVHKRGMRIYQDVEMQYVAGTHPWFTESFGNPKSRYSGYLMYDDAENKKPWWFWGFPEFTMYNGSKQKIITVNMDAPAVKEYTRKVLRFWVDPNNDGKFDDGVDGFRLDHMMDNLDNANRLTNLFTTFWTPLFTDLRQQNPKLKFVAEQANWASYGHDYYTKGSVDYVFAFRLKFAINKFDKAEIEKAADSTFNFNPQGKDQFVFIENHDTKRFASEPGMTVEKAKAAAAIQILIGGIPSLYYGQELGMKGEQRQLGITDGNDIGVREAFEWYASESGTGTADWYRQTGPWWDQRFNKPNDGTSLEEQRKDPESLWNFYRELLQFRKAYTAVHSGVYEKFVNPDPKVLSFSRTSGKEKVVVFVNLSESEQRFEKPSGSKMVFGGQDQRRRSNSLPPYGVAVFQMK